MRTPQQIAREALDGPTSNSALAAFLAALREIASLPESAPVRAPEPVPFALPMSESKSIPVARVESAEVDVESVVLWIGDEGIHASPPYAAAWLRLFGLPENGGGK